MELFSVSMIFRKTDSNHAGIAINKEGLSVFVLWAASEAEAFGMAYENAQKGYKDWALSSRVVVPIHESLRMRINNK